MQKEALGQGLQQVLWLYGEDHLITEVGTMNIFMFCVNDNGGNVSPVNDSICWNISFEQLKT
jgi:branched-subunit amino acid aminotransferase/4-amino-4-deoxychorismate lyase